jgi:hypothetical protein
MIQRFFLFILRKYPHTKAILSHPRHVVAHAVELHRGAEEVHLAQTGHIGGESLLGAGLYALM